jgi:hypothetical protein
MQLHSRYLCERHLSPGADVPELIVPGSGANGVNTTWMHPDSTVASLDSTTTNEELQPLFKPKRWKVIIEFLRHYNPFHRPNQAKPPVPKYQHDFDFFEYWKNKRLADNGNAADMGVAEDTRNALAVPIGYGCQSSLDTDDSHMKFDDAEKRILF